MSSVSLAQINHQYDDTMLLQNWSLHVNSGDFVSLIGPSGCGKTTVLRLIAGLEKLQSGSIEIDGKDVTTIGPARRGVGMVFQYPSLFPHLNVAENIAFGIRNFPRNEQRASTAHWLEALGIAGFEKKYPHQLSGGEQQRVALARALVLRPKVLLLDEPFANLDTLLRRSMRDEVLGLLKQQKITTLLVTHDPVEALAVSDRVAVMGKGGKLHQYDSPSQLQSSPADEFVSMLIASA